MEIQYKEIPKNILNHLPRGLKLVRRSGKSFLVIENTFCPNGHSLMDNSILINGIPAVRIKISDGLTTGYIYCDSFWGSHAKLYSFIPKHTDSLDSYNVCCPICDANMIVERKCTQENCNSNKEVELILPGNNKIFVCAKLGCPGHYMEIKEAPNQIVKSISDINYFIEELDYDDFFKGV
ncbi:MAG TPA: hypothetical protein QF753_01800 [Victivallales bacterium]|nr:hypothetical protein [Victivallales bacterium]